MKKPVLSLLLFLIDLTGIIVFGGMFLCGNEVYAQALRPYSANSYYWQYKGQPVLLLGGFQGAHNVFLEPNVTDPPGNLKALMDEMVSAGGNVMRVVFDPGKAILKGYPASHKKSGGKYDLSLFTSGSSSFWGKFETLLNEARKRDIIVQLEVWDRFDWRNDAWLSSPFRPANNINYTTSTSGLDDSYSSYKNNPFSSGVPGHPDYDSASSSRKARYDLVRSFQDKYIDHMLSISLKYENVLYTMNNETHTDVAWGLYWMDHIEKEAAKQGKTVYVTDMFDNGWKLQNSSQYSHVFANPDEYTFVDISQNNATKNTGGPEGHWANILYTRNKISGSVRPINNTKIYGADTEEPSRYRLGVDKSFGDLAGQNSFWMNVIGGMASARFHRPTSGIGLGSLAKASMRAARKLETKVKLWELKPRNDLLTNRGKIEVSFPGYTFSNEPFVYGEAYLAAKPGEKYALYFTRGGSVGLNLNAHTGRSFSLNWINIDTGKWGPSTSITGGKTVTISAPNKEAWVAAIAAQNTTALSAPTGLRLQNYRQ